MRESYKQKDRLNILVVEDHTLFARNIKKSLPGHNFHYAATVEEGVETYKESLPDIVLLDINLPDGSGYDAFEEIREFDPHAFIVMLTGSSLEGDVMRSKELHADGYILKPPTAKKLQEYIEQYHHHEDLLKEELIKNANKESEVRLAREEMKSQSSSSAPKMMDKDAKTFYHRLVTSEKSEALKKIHILFVDNQYRNREQVESAIQKLECTITSVSSGKDAQEALQGEEHFGLIIIDCNLDDFDGFNLTSLIRQEERKNNRHYYILGIGTAQRYYKQWKKSGMDEYYEKPLPIQKLCQYVIDNAFDIAKS